MAGLVHDPDEVFVEIEDAAHGDWAKVFLPLLRHMPLRALMRASGLSRRPLQEIRKRQNPARPRKRHRVRLEAIAHDYARELLQAAKVEIPKGRLATCARAVAMLGKGSLPAPGARQAS